jgi:hypothetical protein
MALDSAKLVPGLFGQWYFVSSTPTRLETVWRLIGCPFLFDSYDTNRSSRKDLDSSRFPPICHHVTKNSRSAPQKFLPLGFIAANVA